MKISIIMRPLTFAAALFAAATLFACDVSAQSGRGETGPTGDPLIDSILQAPGPAFLDPRGGETDEDGYRDRRPPPRGGWRDRRGDDRGYEPDDVWDPREPRTAARGGVPKVAPPAPEQRGQGPSDVVILDADDIGAPERAADAPQTPDAAPATDETAATPHEDTAEQSEQETAAAAEPPPYREQPWPDTAAPQQPAAPAQAPARPRPDPELNRMIGQMLLVGFPGQQPSDAGVRNAARDLEDGAVGGVILMSRNIKSPGQVKKLTGYFKRAGKDRPTPFIGVDQEGGYVQRLSRTKGFKTHPSAERLGAHNDPQGAYSAYRNLALELRKYGFNLNFGPVVDLNINPANPVIARLRRSFGENPDHVSAFAKAFVFAHHESGVLTAAKHFPGHGSSKTDSHDQLVDISQSWTEKELRPYRKLIEAKAVDMIMVGHLYHPSFSDTPDTPVSLSKKGITGVLRKSLNYNGVIITDDLHMRGVRQNTGFEERILGAVEAGNDILMITNANGYQDDLAEHVRSVIRRALDTGRLSVARIRESYQRIMALKDKLSRLQRTATSAGEDRGLAGHSSGG